MLFLLVLHVTWLPLYAQVIITEVQPAPAAGEPEWIELENMGGRSVNLANWLVCDARSCIRIPQVGAGVGSPVIPAHGRLVLTRDAEALGEMRTLPIDVSVVELMLPSLNNSTEWVCVRNADSVVVDAMAYNMRSFIKGRSVERSGWEQGSGVAYDTVWAACVASDSATCGMLNSAVHLPRDLRVGGTVVYDADVGIQVVNHGQASMPPVHITLHLRCGTHTRTIHTTTTTLLVTEVFEWRVPLVTLGWPEWEGAEELLVVLDDGDDRLSNDTAKTMLMLPPPPGVVSLSEIMYDPWAPIHDYVEVYNSGQTDVDLTSWQVADASGSLSTVSTLCTVAPQGYAVISPTEDVRSIMDTGVVALCKPSIDWNMSGDRVVLRNASGFLVDACEYAPTWHVADLPSSKGVSLEKRNPLLASGSDASWTSSGSLRGGTPGAPNSVHTNLETTYDLHASPSPFSSNRASALHPSVISYVQPYQHAILSLHIHRPDGVLVRTLLNAVFTGSEGAVAWDGTTDDGLTAVPGQYVAVLECVDIASSRTHRARCVVVVGE